ncbi:hypothetical protein PV328_001248 [Microctonus aethiopoides]|uniref:Uncharacterized protein n=1 Tax=Microctonus aethiopoides TaxID=144406 RepID=A0AA39FX99_9HYME|nr:hypothetical protein PV328_001248 [Microctonus aethiopoides]
MRTSMKQRSASSVVVDVGGGAPPTSGAMMVENASAAYINNPMGMEKLFRATPIYGSDSLFIQLKFLFLKTTIRPFVSEISSCECKRILFHSIPDIDATTGRTANQRAVPKSGENFLQGSAMLFW